MAAAESLKRPRDPEWDAEAVDRCRNTMMRRLAECPHCGLIGSSDFWSPRTPAPTSSMEAPDAAVPEGAAAENPPSDCGWGAACTPESLCSCCTLFEVARRTVEEKDSKLVLIQGPRGCGKTLVCAVPICCAVLSGLVVQAVHCVLEELRQRQHKFVVIKLDGRLHADDAMATRAVALQLQANAPGLSRHVDDKKKATFFDNLDLMLDTISNGALGCPVSARVARSALMINCADHHSAGRVREPCAVCQESAL